MQLKVQFQKVLQQLDTDQLQRCARFLNSSAGDNDDDDGLDEEFEGAAAHGASISFSRTADTFESPPLAPPPPPPPDTHLRPATDRV